MWNKKFVGNLSAVVLLFVMVMVTFRMLDVDMILFGRFATRKQAADDIAAKKKPASKLPPLTAATVCPKTFKLPVKRKSWSQSREDIGLFQQLFSNPLMCKGTFLEIGALDGVRYSNTLSFETYLGWSGVLIEANPSNAAKLMKNRRKTRNFAMAVCDEGVETLKFRGRAAVGGVVGEMSKKHEQVWIKKQDKIVEIPCKPLYWILQKANVKHLDFFSLDVEGSEYEVLKTMDWSIPVRAFVFEVHGADPSSKDAMVRKLLQDHGYQKASWKITSYCLKGRACAGNEVWENPNYPAVPKI